MRVTVEIRAEILVDVERGGEDAVRHVATDWILHTREGFGPLSGAFLVKGLSGAVDSVRPFVPNRRVVGQREFFAEERGIF